MQKLSQCDILPTNYMPVMTFPLQRSKLNNILFLDIETVSSFASYEKLDKDFQKLWTKKASSLLKLSHKDLDAEAISSLYENKAAIYSEYAKIVCITVGYLKKKKEHYELRLKSFYDHDETKILNDFSSLIEKHFNDPKKDFFCGHNIKEFDIPFIGRRMLINGLKLPNMLNLVGKKPWETEHLLDTLQLWKFGDFKNYISLDLLAKILNVPSPKVNMDGSMVGEAYWKEGKLEEIKDYCELDVVTSVNVFLKLNGYDVIEEVVTG